MQADGAEAAGLIRCGELNDKSRLAQSDATASCHRESVGRKCKQEWETCPFSAY